MAAFTDNHIVGDGWVTRPTRYERMMEMDEPWGPSSHLDPGWYPFTFSLDSSGATSSTINITWDSLTNNTHLPIDLPDEAWEGDSLRQQHYERSRQDVCEARMALRRVRDDPGGRVPLQARKAPYTRPRSKKRVCAGSSRYRVLVN